MKTKIFALFCFCLLVFAATCVAGDSTSIAPAGVTKRSHTYTNGDNVYTGGGKVDTQGGRVYTRGNHVYTSGGHVYAGGGDIRQVRLIKTNRIYGKGSSNWIDFYDHADMNNRVLYDVRRIRVNDYTPSYYKDVASKWYVDKMVKPEFFTIYTEVYKSTRRANNECDNYSNSSRKCYFGSGFDRKGWEYINCMCWPR